MKAGGIALIVALALIGGALFERQFRHHGAFRLSTPEPTTIRALGLVERPQTHPCAFDGQCFDYLGGWCQAPCAVYSVRATVVSVKRPTWRPWYGYVILLRDGDKTIAARAPDQMLGYRRPRRGSRVRVSGVLFFPTPRGRDGGSTPNGAELSPVLEIR